ncbi:MAG: tripartite tricarboxylate transporter substrate binding protein [Betaproteobacteria bacterium]|nr:tripartite tricarboxylate transporter substrate binding protein [Betaproteobacteria bacterium]
MRLSTTISACVIAFAALTAFAQEPYPTRPVNVVVPFPPGGMADLSARPLAAAMEKIWKQPVPIINRPGAGGAVGMQSVSIAKPDGYTVMVTLVSYNTIPEVDAMFGRAPAYSREQFVPIALIAADPPVLVVHPSLPAKSVKDLVALAKKRPNEIVFSHSGVYGPSHVPMEMFVHAAGIKMRHLPAVGGGPTMALVLGGHAGMWASPPAMAVPHIANTKLRALASWGDKRLASLPDVPTFKEVGYDLEFYVWSGMFAPRGVGTAVVSSLRETVRQAVLSVDFKTSMERIKTPIAYLDALEFQKFLEKDLKMLSSAIRRMGKIEEAK